MTAPDDKSVQAAREARVKAAVAADPDLADELQMIEAALDEDVRERFRAAFGEELCRHARPAAAFLAALERAARG